MAYNPPMTFLCAHAESESFLLRATSDGTDGIVNGRSVHREEYGITKGTFWEPDRNEARVLPDGREHGNALLAGGHQHAAEHLQEDPLPDGGPDQSPSEARCVRCGQQPHDLHEYDGAPDDYLTNISWNPSGKIPCSSST